MEQEIKKPTIKPIHPALKLPARVVSYVFHPVLLPPLVMLGLYLFFPFIFAGIKREEVGKLWLILFLNTTFFSLVYVLVCKGLGLVKSLHMPTSKERIIPLLGIMVFYFWCNHVMGNIPHVPFAIRLLVLGGFWCVIGMFLVNIFFKVSLHTTGAGAIVALVVILLHHNPINMMAALLVTIIITGIIGTARLIMGSHSLGEIMVGYLLGIVAQVAAYYYLV